MFNFQKLTSELEFSDQQPIIQLCELLTIYQRNFTFLKRKLGKIKFLQYFVLVTNLYVNMMPKTSFLIYFD